MNKYLPGNIDDFFHQLKDFQEQRCGRNQPVTHRKQLVPHARTGFAPDSFANPDLPWLWQGELSILQ